MAGILIGIMGYKLQKIHLSKDDMKSSSSSSSDSAQNSSLLFKTGGTGITKVGDSDEDTDHQYLR